MIAKPTIKQNNTLIFDSATLLKQPRGFPFNAQLSLSMNQAKILVKIIHRLQKPINETITYFKLKKEPYQLSLFQDIEGDEIQLDFELSEFGVNKTNYKKLVKDFVSMKNFIVVKDTIYYNSLLNQEVEAKELKCLIASVIVPKKYERYISCKIAKDVAGHLVKVKNGYIEYLLEIALKSSSKYTLLIYQLISAWRDKGYFEITIQNFKKQLDITDKYKNWKDLNTRVLKPAYRELFEKSDIWFSYSMSKKDNVPFLLRIKVITANYEVINIPPDKELANILDYSLLSERQLECIKILNNQLLINDINIIGEIVTDKISNFYTWFNANEKKLPTLLNPSAYLLNYLGMTLKKGWNAQKWETKVSIQPSPPKNNDLDNPLSDAWSKIYDELSLLADKEDLEKWFNPLYIGELNKEDNKTKIVICIPFESFFQKIETDFIHLFYGSIVKVIGGEVNLSYKITSPK